MTVEVPDDERDAARAAIDAALSGAKDTLWLEDKRGRLVAIPASKIAYIEIGSPDGDRRIGFGS